MCYHGIMGILWAILPVFLVGGVRAEDERSFAGPGIVASAPPEKILFEQFSPEYLLDMTGDGKKERIRFVNRDGRDRMIVADFRGRRVFHHDFRAVGLDATPYKILFRSLSPFSKVLVIHYYEGHTDYIKFMGSARLYFLTFQKNDLKTLSMYRGPSVFYEHVRKGRYRRRSYDVDVADLDGDGKRDILVKYGGIKDVFLYRGEGAWWHKTKPGT